MIENLLPMVRKIADTYAQRFNCPRLGFDDLSQIGSMALVDAARRFEPAPAYNDEGQAEAHLWAFAKPRVIGAMIDAVRREKKSRLVRPVKFVTLEEELELEDKTTGAGEEETIDLVREIYNRYGEQTAEIVVDYAINDVPQHVIAARLGVSQAAVSLQWAEIAEKIKKLWRT